MKTPKTYIPASAIRALVQRWELEIKLLPPTTPEPVRDRLRQCIRDLVMVYDGNTVDLGPELRD